MNNIPKFYVGVDVSKRHLSVFIHPAGAYSEVANSSSGLKQLKKILKKYAIERVVCEASGGYEHLMHQELQAAGYAVWRVPPYQVKAYIHSKGCYVKTDKHDAKMIAEFAAERTPKHEKKLASQAFAQLRGFVSRRTTLIQSVSDEKRHLLRPEFACDKQGIKGHIAYLQNLIKKLDHKIDQCIKSSDEWKRKITLLESVPGVGRVTSTTLFTQMPELGSATRREIAALLGVAPYTRQSGSYRGHSYIRGGRSVPRKALYMAALSASHARCTFAGFYKQLLNAGKPPKVALVALMRKMILTINAMMKKDEFWCPHPFDSTSFRSGRARGVN